MSARSFLTKSGTRSAAARTCYVLFTGSPPPQEHFALVRFLASMFSRHSRERWEKVLQMQDHLQPDEADEIQKLIARRIETEQGAELLARMNGSAGALAGLQAAAFTEDYSGTVVDPDELGACLRPSSGFASYGETLMRRMDRSGGTAKKARRTAAKSRKPGPGATAERKQGSGRAVEAALHADAASASTSEEVPPPAGEVVPSAAPPAPVSPLGDAQLATQDSTDPLMAEASDGIREERQTVLREFFRLANINVLYDLDTAVFLLAKRTGQEQARLARAARGSETLSMEVAQLIRERLGEDFAALDFASWCRAS